MGRQLWKPGNMLYPVPAVMVTCKREGGQPNIITIAWAGTVCSSPAMVSISVRPERYSYDIIKASGEFDKFKATGLHTCPGLTVATPGIAESPVNIECKVKEVIPLGSHHMFLAEVTGVQVDEAYMNENGKFELNQLGLVAYSHGEYFKLGKKLGKFGYSVRKK